MRTVPLLLIAAFLLIAAHLLFPSWSHAWPLDSEWITLTRSFSGLTDIVNDSQGGANDPRDIVTNLTAFPAAYIFNDGTYLFFRIRVDGNALNNQGDGLQPFGWGFLIDTNNDFRDYEWMVMLNGISNPESINIGQNTRQGTFGDPSDTYEVLVWSEPWRLNVNFRSVIANSSVNGGQDYFLDFRIPYSTFKSVTGLTDTSPIRFFVGSSNNARSLTADLVDPSNICTTNLSQCMPSNATDTITPLGTYPATGTVLFVTSLTGTADLTQIYAGQTIYIRVEDLDLNTNHALAQTLTVNVTTQSGDSETATLTETGANTGIFTGALATAGGAPAPGNGTLQVAAIETVTVTYVDAVDASFSTNQTRTDTLVVQRAADLSISKTASTATPAEGVLVDFTLTVTNNGPNSASGIQVTDILPAGLDYVSDTGSGTYNRSTGIWEAPPLTTGASSTLGITVRTRSGTSGSTYTNTAVITASAVFDPVSGNNTASRSITVGGADLALTKAPSDPTPPNGGTVAFTIGLRNNGTSVATGIAVTDLLPAGLSYASSITSQGTYTSSSGIWTVGSLASGATATLIVNANVTGAVGTTVTNTASISASNQADPDASNNAASAAIFISGVDLSLAKSVNNAAPNEGATVVFTLVATNNGLYTAASVTVSDLLPPGLTFLSSAGTGTYSAATGLWSIPTLTSVATVTHTISASVNAGTNGQTITNTATITGSSVGDPNPANNTASASLTVQRADLSAVKTSSNPSPDANQAFSYTVVLKNNGPHSATTITVRDVIDTGRLTYNSASATTGSVAYTAPTLTWSVPGPLVSGATATLIINVTVRNNVQNGTTIQNMVEITGAAQADPVNANNSSIASVVVGVGTTDLAVTKTVNNTAPAEGALVTYTVVVSNISLTQATNVTVGDALAAGLAYAAGSSSVSQGNYNAGSGAWTIGTLNSGATATMLLAATVNAGTTGQTINNTATITGRTEIDLNLANDAASASLVVGATDLAVTKTVNNATPNVGDAVVYTVGLRNNGPNTATTIVMTDLLPAGLTFSSALTTAGSYTNGTGLWSLPTLSSGTTATLTITATVNAGTGGSTITNTAVRTSAVQPDNVAGNNSASASVTVQSADLSVTKTASTLTPNELAPFLYTVTVTNNGPNDASGIVVQDLLSSNLTYSVHVVSQGTYTPSSGTWSVGAIARNASATLQITARPNLGTGGTNIPNTASIIAAAQEDPNSANNVASITITPVAVPLPNLVMVKSVQTLSDPYNGAANPKSIPGAVMIYTVTVVNSGTGPTDAGSLALTDPIPTNTSMCVSNVCSNPPVSFTCSAAPACGLSYTYASSVAYTNRPGGVGPYDYTPAPDAAGYDAAVTGFQVRPSGAFNGVAGGPPYSQFTIQFRVRVQ